VGTQRARSGRWREASPDARIGPIQEGRGRGARLRGLEAAWDGALVGVESQGLRIDCL
jgi:hypothetical protein